MCRDDTVMHREIRGKNFEIHLLGKGTANIPWNIGHIKTREDLKSPKALQIFERLEAFALSRGILTVYAPTPSAFNAELCEPDDLAEVIERDEETALFTLRRGAKADGLVIPVGTAFFVASADCPTIVVTSSQGVLAAHAGRDSLMDTLFLLSGTPRRSHMSVVDAICKKTENWNIEEIFVVGGIGAEHFSHPWDHPQFGRMNCLRTKYAMSLGGSCLIGNPDEGKLDLYQIIKEQFAKNGARYSCVLPNTADTYGDKDENGWHLWWSARRGDTGRNGIFVIRKQ